MLHFEDFFLTDVQDEMNKIIGPTTQTIMMNAAKCSGKKVGKKLFSKGGNKKRTIIKYFKDSGLGDIVSMEISEEDKTATVEIKNTVFKRVYKKGKHHTCSYVAGILSGLFSVMFGKDVNFEEVSCESRGDKVCKFVITHKLGFEEWIRRF